jgi:hypothetical protein
VHTGSLEIEWLKEFFMPGSRATFDENLDFRFEGGALF